MTLASLKPGQRAVTLRVEGADPLSLRLMEMGFTPGTPVDCVGEAPGGDPMLVKLRGYSLSLSRSDAGRIGVREAEA